MQEINKTKVGPVRFLLTSFLSGPFMASALRASLIHWIVVCFCLGVRGRIKISLKCHPRLEMKVGPNWRANEANSGVTRQVNKFKVTGNTF